MTFAEPIRLGLDEFGRDERAFDGASYLYANEDVRAEIGFDVEGAWRHWTSVGHMQGRYPPGLGRTAPRNIDRDEMASRPFGLNVFGPFAAISGLGTAARNLLEAVRASGVPFDVHPYDVESGQARITTDELAAPVRFRTNLVLANADQIRRVAGLYPDGTFDSAYTIGVWAWELAAFRPDWHASFALVDEIWTNSQFELASIAATSPVPVRLMPLPVIAPPEVDRTAARARFGLGSDAFVFLCAFDAGSTEQRKNPFAALAAFRDAFGTDPRHVLVVKHHGASSDLTRRLFAARHGAENIRMLGARLEEADQQALQVACDAFVSPHRSEGFGLNLAEFIAAGRAVIGTDYSGSRDFLDRTTGYPVASRLVEVGRRAGPYLQHSVWAEPDRDGLIQAMRACVVGGGTRAEAARARMAESFSVHAIGARLRDRLGAIETGTDTPDGFASTALASLSLFVPPDPARARIAWPARLPTFSIVRETADEGLAGQLYPFWELCLVADAPPPEDAAARALLRGGDLRVRLLNRKSDERPAAIVAAETASGAWLVLLAEGTTMAPGALLAVAEAIDNDTPPDLVSLGPVPLRPSPPLAVRKATLLGAWAETPEGKLDDLLQIVARSGAVLHLPHALLDPAVGDNAPDPLLPEHARVSVRFRDAEARAAWSVPADAAIDLYTLPSGGDARSMAETISRGVSAEHVVLVEDGRAIKDRDALDRLVAWLADRQTGGVTADGVFASRRAVLERLARLPAMASFADGLAKLGLPLVRLPLSSGRPAPAAEHARDAALSLAEHAARLEALGLFDRDHYLVSSPDVAASGTDPLLHYVEYGWREHRAPNFYFDPVWYRARYMEEGEDLDPLLHYARYRNSGVRPARHFDPAWVRRSRHLPPGVDPLRYFLERRRSENVSPLPEFDPAWYRARRRDIVYRRVDPFEHYMRFGAAEGVNPSADFDTAFYAARHMVGVGPRDPVVNNPLLHYLENRDRQPAITSLKAALRQEIARLQLLGRSFIEMTFCWYDGLPQRIEALRTYLAEPTLAMPFLLVFANELLAASSTKAGDTHLTASLRLPLTDDYDDSDICARLVECFADPRCLRRDDRPILAFVRGAVAGPVEAFADRLDRRLRADHALEVEIELLD